MTKKIEFGYSNDFCPNGSHEGMGIRQDLMLCDADYYGAFEFDGNNYILAKVTKDEFNRYPQLLNKFIIRKALCDLYPDLSCVLMLNQSEDVITKQLESYINDSIIKENIHSINDVLEFSSRFHKAPRTFSLVEQNETIVATSIISDAFDKKNEAIKNCHSPISELQQLRDEYHYGK